MTTAPCESIFADKTIFVVGTRRSGTTWLGELLLAHPDITGPGTFEDPNGQVFPIESLIFGSISDMWVNGLRPELDGIGTFMDRPSVVAALRMYCDRIFDAARQRFGPQGTWFLDKSPDNVYRVPILATTHPDAWVIHIIRDGRDVAKSLTLAPFADIRNIADGASEWSKHVGLVLREKWRLPRLHEIRYEELLANPIDETLAMFEWMGLDVTDDLLETLRQRVDRPVARFKATAKPGTGRWRDMDPNDLEVIYEIAGDLLAELGYLNDDGDNP